MLSTIAKVDATHYAHSGGSFVKGKYTQEFATGATIRIVIPQPMSQSELQLQPQGERELDYRITWTLSDVVATDRIAYDNTLYRVMRANKRSESNPAFTRIAMREVKADEL